MIKRHDGIIVDHISRILIPFIRLFALYVLFHGHYSPGGGFQAGVLIGAGFVLELLIGTKREVERFSVQNEFVIAGMGVVFFLALGVLAMFYGGNFLDYATIEILGHGEEYRRYYAILLAEVGVTVAVAMTVVVIFHVLAFLPRERS